MRQRHREVRNNIKGAVRAHVYANDKYIIEMTTSEVLIPLWELMRWHFGIYWMYMVNT